MISRKNKIAILSIRTVQKERLLLVLTLILSALFSIFTIIILFYFKYVIDIILPQKNMLYLFNITLCFFILLIARFLFDVIRKKMLCLFAKKIDLVLGDKYFKHIFKLPLSKYIELKTGDLLSRLDDSTTIRSFIISITVNSLLEVITLITGFIILFIQNGTLCLLALVLAPVLLLSTLFFKKPYEDLINKAVKDQTNLRNSLIECLSGVSTIQSMSSLDYFIYKNTMLYRELINSSYRSNNFINIQYSLVDFLNQLSVIIIIFIGTYQISGGLMTIGQLVAFISLANYFITPLQNLVNLQPLFKKTAIASERLNTLFNISQNSYKGSNTTIPLYGNIILRNISFSYQDNNPLISSLDLSITKGSKVALVGINGSGKSTLLRIIARLENNYQGDLIYDNANAHEIDYTYFRSKIIYTPQSFHIFSGTILDNLCLFNKPELSYIDKVVTDLGFSGFINSFPDRYSTIVGENGITLSSGQRQMLAIARAFITDANIYLFDEVFTNLSQNIENIVIQYISTKLKDKTIISVTHNYSVLSSFDLVACLHNGRITDIDTYDKLRTTSAYFHEIFHEMNK